MTNASPTPPADGPFARWPAIIGPTAGGKSALAMRLARAIDERFGLRAELVSVDSVQVYRGMDIGSAKPAPDERAAIPHHVIDLAEPEEKFSVEQWLDHAERALAGIAACGRVPILVGGTLLYIKAFLEGLAPAPSGDETLRAELNARPLGELRAELERIDPASAARIHPNDRRRAVRAIEVFRLTGAPVSDLHERAGAWDRGSVRPGWVLVGLSWRVEGEDGLNRRINARVRAMMDHGLLDETRALRGRLGETAREALGYKQLLAHLDGALALDDAVEQIKVQTRRFAKNQRTWLRRLSTTPGSVWIPRPDTSEGDAVGCVLRAMTVGVPSADE